MDKEREMTEERNPAEEAAQVRLDLGHYHPLIPITNEETKDSWDLTCYGCEQPIKDMSFYGCKQCLFFLHPSCRDLPRQLTHFYHPQHSLTLLPSPPSITHICDICRGSCNRFIYRCDRCDYDIDMKCATVVLTIQQRINHPSHEHQLTPLLQESMFLCGGCGKEHKGTSFLCTTCGFWINQKCASASSPPNLKLNHPHTLFLFYFVEKDNQPCKICHEKIHRRYWVYRCSECRDYVVHFHCAMSAKEHSTNNETKIEGLDSTISVTTTSDVARYT
ncbi:hypothetical protein Vadar_000258 [Vaccinium darrowii]|uniref:Uncharacterized protein n=1 Tax=Vaccinium darrowii TaxID=229202 RepID=A0ACB7YHZ5_9ERIC|nr:hypothetical protein Vadar_000258 [Vaccinium darrowii]